MNALDTGAAVSVRARAQQTTPSSLRIMKAIGRGGLKAILPAPLFWRFRAWRIGYFDVELRLLPYLCDRNMASIDVGASAGSYTVHLLNHSAKCYAFEPI